MVVFLYKICAGFPSLPPFRPLLGCRPLISCSLIRQCHCGMGAAPLTGGPQIFDSSYAAGSLPGRLTKVDLNGDWVWSKSFSGVDYTFGGLTNIILNECWGEIRGKDY